MAPMPVSTANYAGRFRCIGPDCEDTCCQGWKIPVDEAALGRYRELPGSALKLQILASILPAPPSAPGFGAEHAATCTADANGAGTLPLLRMGEDGRCVLLTPERLCSVHVRLGEAFLPSVCASYPRVERNLIGTPETALALSCPEAARLVLLGPSLLGSGPSGPRPGGSSPVVRGLHEWKPGAESFGPGHDAASPKTTPGASAYDAEIRSTVLALIGARHLELWQRLCLVCVLCQRLDAIAAGRLDESISSCLELFAPSQATGALIPSMELLPFDPQTQLDAVLRLAGLMLHRSRVSPRFSEAIAAFTSGIGNGPAATLATLTAAYNAAYRQWYEPFERQHPQVLENYLVNLIVLHRFPIGRGVHGAPAEPPPVASSGAGSSTAPGSKGREVARLMAQFALTRGILIGVAGHHRERFSPEHVVHTVQAISRHFDHHPEFLSSAHALIAESRLDGIAGHSILLRNTPVSRLPSRCTMSA